MRAIRLTLVLLLGNLAWSQELCTVAGQVVDKVTGASLRKVTVTLSASGSRAGAAAMGRGNFPMIQGRVGGGGNRAMQTDAEGRFRFDRRGRLFLIIRFST